METDSNPQPQKTAGLKLMTVFIGVLALHVVVIGGFTVYHFLNVGSGDTDVATTDKIHKDVKETPDGATVSDGQLPPDGTAPTKTASTDATDSSGTPITIPSAPAGSDDSTAMASTAPAPATTASTSAPGMTGSTTVVTVPSAPATASTSQAGSNQNSGPIAQPGPVITPAPTGSNETAIDAPAASTETPASAPTMDETGNTSSSTYMVKSGDTLTKIAHRHHIKLAALIAANNGVKSNSMRIGQKLTIPAPTAAAAPATSTSTDAVATTAAPADSTKTQLDGTVATTAKAKHHLHTLHSEPNRTLLGDSPEITGKPVAATTHDKSMLSSGGHHVYTVMKGDTLNKIAHKFHTSTTAIMALNDINNTHKLRLGEKLRIPSRESRSATSAPTSPQQQNPDQIEPRATPSAQLANFIN